MTAVRIKGLRHSYPGKRGEGPIEVLKGIDLVVKKGRIFGLLGPNGSGKTTLFKILSTLFQKTDGGDAEILGLSLSGSLYDVRRKIGVVFQNPSLDGKLTIEENLYHQGKLYGMTGRLLQDCIEKQLASFSLADRRSQRAEELSGGLKRRVELAKGIMHDPELLILDEPSTGLDVTARRSLWETLIDLRDNRGVTILLTTHLIAEAERCDELAVLDKGTIVAQGGPEDLKREIGGDIITISSSSPDELIEKFREKFDGNPMLVNGKIRVERTNGHRFISELVEAFPRLIDGVAFGKPTLEDFFIQRTGHLFRNGQGEEN